MSKKIDFELPEPVDGDVLKDFLKVRKTPLTKTACKLTMNIVDKINNDFFYGKKIFTLQNAFEYCLAEGWQGLKFSYVNKKSIVLFLEMKNKHQKHDDDMVAKWREKYGQGDTN